ncbi:MAG: hypothetical protein IKG11_06935 [Atopobiaceae bacterium]|nr:hypothetical protein [Atopobiaceae bacterium]
MRGHEIADDLSSHFVLFSCEGAAEGVVVDKLVSENALKIAKDRIVQDPIYFKPYTRLRKPEEIAQRFFGTSYTANGSSGLLLARIIDSRAPRFILPRRWVDSCVVENFYTRPEIEMLVIHAENAYEDWLRCSRKNRQLRPSEFCKGELKLHDIKSASYLAEYWTIESLTKAIRAYDAHRQRASGELSLGDLLA